MTPTIEKLFVTRTSDDDQMAIILITDNEENANRLDFCLDGYSIGWQKKDEDAGAVFVRSPRLGSYGLDLNSTSMNLFESATRLRVAYRLETGQLMLLPARELNLVTRPNF